MGSCEENKLIRVAWDRCCKPYSQGGLGLKDLGLLNDSLLKKLTWKFMTSQSFAFSFLRERYLTQLRKSHGDLLKEGIWLIDENSQRDFWLDNWFGVPILELLEIPDYLASLLRARVSDFIHDGRWVLDDSFRAHFPDLCFRIDRIAISPVADSLVWAHSRDGQAMSVSFSDQLQVLRKITIHAVVWSVWLARNQWIFESKAMEFRSALSLVCRAVSDANRSVIWSPPAPGWIKVNTDGAALSSPGVGGCGGVFRNYRTFVKGCFTVPFGQVFTFEVELLAASMAINLAWQNGWHRIWLESDSSYVVHLLASRSEQQVWPRKMDPEEVARLCASLSLTDRDGSVHMLEVNLRNEAVNRMEGFEIESVTGNVFTFHFNCEHDRQRVISGGPWSFSNALMVLTKPEGMGTIDSIQFQLAEFWVQIHQVPILCMTKKIGWFLGSLIGEVADVDGGNASEARGKFMRVKVRIELDKPLMRCLRIDILGDGVESILLLRPYCPNLESQVNDSRQRDLGASGNDTPNLQTLEPMIEETLEENREETVKVGILTEIKDIVDSPLNEQDTGLVNGRSRNHDLNICGGPDPIICKDQKLKMSMDSPFQLQLGEKRKKRGAAITDDGDGRRKGSKRDSSQGEAIGKSEADDEKMAGMQQKLRPTLLESSQLIQSVDSVMDGQKILAESVLEAAGSVLPSKVSSKLEFNSYLSLSADRSLPVRRDQ
ncbi:hypothetical protein Dsin_017416 [Dipteronia sinensis]|uniref:RNase H type-1 domain-containing protein n=1 Tax=Dipteronia sinensis TaxID=43782 RepID=A0AAE0AGD9_9ROSI|nr:hypothetical protein Dsin_017416 [Dipteronia sinensis]